MIYFDNAATTPLDDSVLAAMIPYFKNAFGNPQSPHSAGRAANEALISARDNIARVFGCNSGSVYFLSGGTEAGNLAVKGVCAAHGKGHIVVSAIEHPAVLESARDMQKLGFELTEIAPDSRGIISPESVEAAIRPDTVFCALMAVNNETGTIQPYKEIGGICKKRGVFYYCDFVQAVGLMPFPTEYCSAFAVSAHKFYGPKGAAAMYVAPNNAISRLISGGRQERGLRGGTVNVAGVVGLSKALELATSGRNLPPLKKLLLDLIENQFPSAELNGDREHSVPTIANISFKGMSGANLASCLDLKGICVSTGSACSAGAPMPSHVICAIAGDERANGAVRFSFGKYNTEDEVRKTVKVLKEILK